MGAAAMSAAQDVLTAVLDELARAKTVVSRQTARQIRKSEERDYLKSVAYSWFNSHRPLLRPGAGPDLSLVDAQFQQILEATDRASTKGRYLAAIKEAASQVRALRGIYLVPTPATSSDAPPSFGSLASDAGMQAVLESRWTECQLCLEAGAHLAATVMMGGLLEALFVARANAMPDKTALFSSRATPRDAKTQKPLPLKDWTLRPYIDVAHDLKWITKSGKDVAAVLRDYRNLVHPEKQRSLGIELNEHDTSMFWEITKVLSRQLLS